MDKAKKASLRPQGYQGVQGEPTVYGTNGVSGKSAYELAVGKGYTGMVEELLESLVGEKDDDGLSAFDTYQKYHFGYTGTEEEWIKSLKSADGAQGEQGVCITNAYIGENIHRWIILFNGTKIDAGYVGVNVTLAPTTVTVAFVDYDGTILET